MIRTLSNIHHDGTLYAPGQEIPSLTDEQAAALVAAGAAEQAPEQAPEQAEQRPGRSTRPTSPAD
jgi:hypothetical protein